MKTPDTERPVPKHPLDPPEIRVPPSPMMDYYEKRQASGKGGYRPGAGRKQGVESVTPEMRRVPVQIRLPQFMVDWMLAQDRSITKTIEYAVRKIILEIDGK